MSIDSSAPLAAKIAHARDLAARPRLDRLLPYLSVGQLLEARAAETPDKVWMIWYDREGNRGELTYHAFLQRVHARVRVLLDAGIHPGDRVATYSGNYPETALTYFACWYLGATVVPLSVSEDDAHLRFIIQNSQVKVIFTRPELVEGIGRVLEDGKVEVEVEVEEEGRLSIPAKGDNASVGGNPPLPPPSIEGGEIDCTAPSVEGGEFRLFPAEHPEQEALIVYTSGTTGNPKGVLLDHYNLLVDGLALANHHKITPESRMMCVLPIHHVNGTIVTMVTPLVAGSSFVLNERFSVKTFFHRLAVEEVAVVSVVPTLLAFLLEANASTEGLNLKVHHIICGAGPLTVDLAMRFEERYGIPIAHGYGLSETTCYSCCLPVDQDLVEHKGWMSAHGYPSIGPALPVNEMAIHDSDGKPLQAGERGEIVIRGHNVMIGYFQNETANQTAFEFGWFRSGDEGFWLPGPKGEPYYFITGRLKELIIRGGVNIAPLEIDEVLMAIQGVKAGISVGFPHDLYGEEVGAYVQLLEGVTLTSEEIITACQVKLPYQKTPKVVLFGDKTPVTSTGKYQRNKLKPLFADYQNVRFK